MRLIGIVTAGLLAAAPAMAQQPTNPAPQSGAKGGQMGGGPMMQGGPMGSGPMMQGGPMGGGSTMQRGAMRNGPMMQGDHSMHGGLASGEYMDAMRRMNHEMMQVSDRDPSRAFALMMIPHHQGAIDNARVVLKHTKDAELRRMAEQSIAEQEKAIASLKSWLQRHGGLSGAAK